jgi:hypothetical protein
MKQFLMQHIFKTGCQTSALHKNTPYEAWHGSKTSVNDMRIFGYLAYAHILGEEWRKLADKRKNCIMVGYNLYSKAYCIYDPITHEIIVRRDIIFYENSVLHKSTETKKC